MMDLLIFVGLIVFIVGIVGLIKGNVKSLKIKNRKVAFLVVIGGFVMMSVLASKEEAKKKSVEEKDKAKVEERIDKIYQEGLNAIEQKNWDLALKLLKGVERVNPNYKELKMQLEKIQIKYDKEHIEELYQQSLRLKNEKKLGEALSILQRVNKAVPNYKQTKNNIFYINQELQKIEKSKVEADAEAKEEAEKKSMENTLREKVHQLVIDVMGNTVNWSKKPNTVIEISLIKQISGGYAVNIRYRANENLSKGWTKDTIIMDVMEFTKKLYSNPSFSQINIYLLMPHLMLVDIYGKESEEQVAKIVLTRDIAVKINWENMYQKRFEQLLQIDGQLWIHPAINLNQ